MNENTGNSGNDFFYDLLDNPADLSHSNAFNLQLLINDFPQSGLLRSMLAVKRGEESLQSASAYVNPKLLYKIATTVGALPVVSEDQIAVCEEPHQGKTVLPAPGSVELPNLVIDENNYFHVPIDPELIYKPDQDEETLALVEDNTEYIEQTFSSEVSEEGFLENAADDDRITDLSQPEAEPAPASEPESEPQKEIEEAETEVVLGEIDDDKHSGVQIEGDAGAVTVTEETPEPEEDSTADTESSLKTDTETIEESESETGVALLPEAEVEEKAVAAGESQNEEVVDEREDENADPGPEEESEEEHAIEDEIHEEVTENDTQSIAVAGEQIQLAPAEETNATEIDSEATERKDTTGQEIDDEVFEEIVSIEDIGLEQLAIINKVTDEDEPEETGVSDEQKAEERPAGDSYFVFEPTLPEDEKHRAPTNILAQSTTGNKGSEHVSRYNDEKMPYSFMWWLDKTRKEHAAIYQPFAAEGKFHTEKLNAEEKPQPASDHLQQQYIENIFAVTAAVSDLNVTPPVADAPHAETKADKIIEKFIHEEPQIKHPSKIKLDSENKAKKSSEDRDELVTETLAKIYTEQMLYHKAILTYKKLMLKFPEKSLYFAGQIEQLENKIN